VYPPSRPWGGGPLAISEDSFLSLSLFFSLSRLCQCVTGFLTTFLLSCVRAVLLVINCLLSTRTRRDVAAGYNPSLLD
jgi:hypothetical protein